MGPCIVVSRRHDTGRHDEHGDRIAFVPVTTAEIHECVNIETHCQWARAGLDMGAGWMQDDDLYPLSALMAEYMAYREDQENKRRPRPDPGE